MSPSPRGPRACLLLFGLALGAAVALETMPGEGPVAVSVAVGSVDPGSVDPAPGIDEPAPGTTMPSRRAPGGMLTAGALGGQGAPGSARAERGGPQATDDPGARRAGDVRPPVRDGWTATAVDQWARRTAPALLAGVGGLELLAPVVDPVVIGFHEASTSAGLELHPLGRLLANDNRTRFTPPPEVRDGAQPYVILASRGRAAGPTTAVDVVAHQDAAVVAPVTGRVTDIRGYTLYGSYPDHRIEVQPHQDPSLRVVLVHVSDVEVEVGDLVIAGTSVVARRATAFPFRSQIDRETEPELYPHVHLEVQPFDAPRPGDPR